LPALSTITQSLADTHETAVGSASSVKGSICCGCDHVEPSYVTSWPPASSTMQNVADVAQLTAMYSSGVSSAGTGLDQFVPSYVTRYSLVSLMLPAPTQSVVEPHETYGTTGCCVPPEVLSVCGWPQAVPLKVIESSAPSKATQKLGLPHDTLVSSEESSELLGSIGAGVDHVVPLKEMAFAAPSTAMQKVALGHDTEKNPAPELGSMDCGCDHELPLKIMTLAFESPTTQKDELAHDTLCRLSSASLPAGIVESMFVAVDQVPVYTNALPAGSVATQNDEDAHEIAFSPWVPVLSTFTGADHAAFPAGADVPEPWLLGEKSDPSPDGSAGGLEPHATASNPAAPAAMSVSLDRLKEIPDCMSYHHSCATSASDNGGEYTAIPPNVCFARVVRQ
jgi:hypothetical protein